MFSNCLLCISNFDYILTPVNNIAFLVLKCIHHIYECSTGLPHYIILAFPDQSIVLGNLDSLLVLTYNIAFCILYGDSLAGDDLIISIGLFVLYRDCAWL